MSVAQVALFGVGPGSGVSGADTWTVVVIVVNSGVVFCTGAVAELTRTWTTKSAAVVAVRAAMLHAIEPPAKAPQLQSAGGGSTERKVVPGGMVSDTTVLVAPVGPALAAWME